MLIPGPACPSGTLFNPGASYPFIRIWILQVTGLLLGVEGLSFTPHFALTPRRPSKSALGSSRAFRCQDTQRMTNAGSYNSPSPSPLRTFHNLTSLKGKGGRWFSPEHSARQVRAAGPHCPLDPMPTRRSARGRGAGRLGAGLGEGRAGGGGAALLRPRRLQGCAGASHLQERGPRSQPNATRHPGPRSTGPPPRARPALPTGPPARAMYRVRAAGAGGGAAGLCSVLSAPGQEAMELQLVG